MRAHQLSKTFLSGALYEAIQKRLIRIYCMNWRFKFIRQHERLASGAATGINHHSKMMLWERSQNVQTQAVVAWTQLVHVGEKEINWIRCFHPG